MKLIYLLFAFTILFQLPMQAQSSSKVATDAEVLSTHALKVGSISSLKDLAERKLNSKNGKAESKKKKKLPPNFLGRGKYGTIYSKGKAQVPDVTRQSTQRSAGELINVKLNFNGLAEFGTPNDPSGDVGPNHYVQAVNATTIQIFDKDGNSVVNPFNSNNLWTSVGQNGIGDPIIIYDQSIQRWLITEFASFGANSMLIAFSDSDDPTGGYTAYRVPTTSFPDYPKFGVWHNSYALTTNESGGNQFDQYFINKEDLLNAVANPRVQKVLIQGLGNVGFFTSTPADWSGNNPPPADSGPIILSLLDDQYTNAADDVIQTHEVLIDWDDQSNTQVITTDIVSSPFDTNPCSVTGPSFACIPQLNGTGLDGIPDIVMNNPFYRNFGSYEVVVLTFVTDVTAGQNLSGIRWVELRKSNGDDWTIFQEGTYAPDDGLDRFMGSVGMDGGGNISLVYATSSPETHPDIRMTGRRDGDPAGEMTFDEFIIVPGESVSQGNGRYGDYFHLSIDPIDDRTFWFTGEYPNLQNRVVTRIAAWDLGKEALDIKSAALVSPMTSATLSNNEVVVGEFANNGLDTIQNFFVGYILDNGTEVKDFVDQILPPDSSYTHSFTTNADLTEIKTYNFKLFTQTEGDNVPFNDTINQSVIKLPTLDAAVINVNGLDNNPCADELEITFTIQNLGVEILTSAFIDVMVNGVLSEQITWTGDLAFEATEIVTTDISGFVNGTNALEIIITNPNNQMDQIIENNGLATEFSMIVGAETYFLVINADEFPAEVSWTLEDENNIILFEGDGYGTNDQNIVELMCLDPEGCYTFTIFDSYGDGICCEYGDGEFHFENEDGELLYQGDGEYGNSQTVEWCPSIVCLLALDIETTEESGEGLADGVIVITVNNGTAPFMYSIDGGNTFQEEMVFNNLTGGIYDIVVMDANDCDVEGEAEVQTISSTSSVRKEYQLSVLPNPNDGYFQIFLSGYTTTSLFLDYEVIDAKGKLIRSGALAKFNDDFIAPVSLVNEPSGVYFIRLKDKGVNNIIKVIKD